MERTFIKKPQERLGRYLKKRWQLHAMLLLPLIVLIIFSYGPMYGVLIAFKDFTVSAGIWGSPWADQFGMENFIRFFKNYNFITCLKNTLTLSVYSLLVSTPCAILLALSLNYVKYAKFRKIVQMLSYAPYFISTIVFVSMINMIFNVRTGVLGQLFQNVLGINVLGDSAVFPSLYVWSGVWQGVGFGAIIYIAALAGVDMHLHEAAITDGASILQRIRYIDIPAILPTAIIMTILSMGSILNVGYEKVYAMQNNVNVGVSEIISTYSYKAALVSTYPDFSYAAAIGLFQSLVGLILVLAVNKLAEKVSGIGFM